VLLDFLFIMSEDSKQPAGLEAAPIELGDVFFTCFRVFDGYPTLSETTTAMLPTEICHCHWPPEYKQRRKIMMIQAWGDLDRQYEIHKARIPENARTARSCVYTQGVPFVVPESLEAYEAIVTAQAVADAAEQAQANNGGGGEGVAQPQP